MASLMRVIFAIPPSVEGKACLHITKKDRSLAPGFNPVLGLYIKIVLNFVSEFNDLGGLVMRQLLESYRSLTQWLK